MSIVINSPYNISENAEKWIKRSAVIVMMVVAISSAILSFDGLQSLALEAGIPSYLAFLFPVAVDFTILMGSLSVLRFELAGAKAIFGWMTVFFGTALSIAGNVLSVKDDGFIAQGVHGLIPILLCVSLESLLKILRFNIKRARTVQESVQQVAESVSVSPAKETASVSPAQVEPAQVAVDPVEHPAPVPAPAPPAPVVAPEPVREEVRVEVPVSPVSPSESVSRPVESAPVERVENTVVESAPVTPEPAAPVVQPEPKEPAQPKPAVKSITQPAIQKTASNNQATAAPKPAAKKAAKPAQGVDKEMADRYSIVLESLPEDTPKARRIAEILRVYPEARTADIREALGDDPQLRLDGTIRRAKELLKKESE